MSEFLLLITKGFFIGIAKIIPGVSGATLAITLGLYERGIHAISNFFQDIKRNILFLLPLSIGMGLAIILASKLIKVALETYYFPTMLLFIGLIIGGIPALLKNTPHIKRKNNVFIFLIAFFLLILLSFITSQDHDTSFSDVAIPSFFTLLVLGIIEATTIVIPGISGTGILMMLGYYSFIIGTLSDLTNFQNIAQNLTIMIPFGLGIGIGIILIAKLMNYLFQKWKEKTYSAILAFTIASITILFIQSFHSPPNITELFIGSMLLVFGAIAAYRLE